MKLDDAVLKQSLLCDASQPLISSGNLEEELELYKINPSHAAQLFVEFRNLTGKELSLESYPEELSGGQKVLLMTLLALHSSASDILFVDLQSALDNAKRAQLEELIGHYSTGRTIRRETGRC